MHRWCVCSLAQCCSEHHQPRDLTVLHLASSSAPLSLARPVCGRPKHTHEQHLVKLETTCVVGLNGMETRLRAIGRAILHCNWLTSSAVKKRRRRSCTSRRVASRNKAPTLACLATVRASRFTYTSDHPLPCFCVLLSLKQSQLFGWTKPGGVCSMHGR